MAAPNSIGISAPTEGKWKGGNRINPSFGIDGVNALIASGTVEDIIVQGGSQSYPAVATLATKLKSSTVNDAAAGTGVQTVLIKGLSSPDYAYVEQTVTMDGSTDVALGTALLRVLDMVAVTVGSGGDADGNIDVLLADNTVVARILATQNRMSAVLFTVPAGYIAYLRHISVSVRALTTVAAGLAWAVYAREMGSTGEVWLPTGISGQVSVPLILVNSNAIESRSYESGLVGPYAAKTDLRVQGLALTGNVHASAGMIFELIEL